MNIIKISMYTDTLPGTVHVVHHVKLMRNHMIFVPSWHDNATFNQKCQSSFYATLRVVDLLHNTYKVNSATHLQ